MNVVMVAAIGQNSIIGIGDELPWKSPEEMRLFKQITEDGIVIVGRNTYKAIGSLRNRLSVVISRSQPTTKKIPYWDGNQSPTASLILNPLDLDQPFEDTEKVADPAECALKYIEQLAAKYKRSTVYVIGGAEIYKMFLPYYTGVVVSFMEASAPESEKNVYMPKEVMDYLNSIEVNRASRMRVQPVNGHFIYLAEDYLCFPRFTHVKAAKV